jgi:hypothetical protein
VRKERQNELCFKALAILGPLLFLLGAARALGQNNAPIISLNNVHLTNAAISSKDQGKFEKAFDSDGKLVRGQVIAAGLMKSCDDGEEHRFDAAQVIGLIDECHYSQQVSPIHLGGNVGAATSVSKDVLERKLDAGRFEVVSKSGKQLFLTAPEVKALLVKGTLGLGNVRVEQQ